MSPSTCVKASRVQPGWGGPGPASAPAGPPTERPRARPWKPTGKADWRPHGLSRELCPQSPRPLMQPHHLSVTWWGLLRADSSSEPAASRWAPSVSRPGKQCENAGAGGLPCPPWPTFYWLQSTELGVSSAINQRNARFPGPTAKGRLYTK